LPEALKTSEKDWVEAYNC